MTSCKVRKMMGEMS